MSFLVYRLLESRHEPVKGAWEDRFEHSYGFWRGTNAEITLRRGSIAISSTILFSDDCY